MITHFELSSCVDRSTATAIVDELNQTNINTTLLAKVNPEDCFVLQIDLTGLNGEQCFIAGACVEDVVAYQTQQYLQELHAQEVLAYQQKLIDDDFSLPFNVDHFLTLDI